MVFVHSSIGLRDLNASQSLIKASMVSLSSDLGFSSIKSRESERSEEFDKLKNSSSRLYSTILKSLPKLNY